MTVAILALFLGQLSADDVEAVLFSDEAAASRCAEAAERVPCLIALRYSKDAAAAKCAQALYDATGTIAGLTAEQDFDGGFRGVIHLVPELPVGAQRKHLEWVLASFLEFEKVMGALAKEQPKSPTDGARSNSASFAR